MSSHSLSIVVVFVIVSLVSAQNAFPEKHSSSATVADTSVAGDLINSYKHCRKVGSSSDFYDKTFIPLLNKYKSDIIAHHVDDAKKLHEMVQVFLLSHDSCDETLPTVLAETLSHRTDLFPDVMKSIPDKQKSEFLHMMQIGVANIEFEATKPGAPQENVTRVCKFKDKFEAYQKTYPYTK